MSGDESIAKRFGLPEELEAGQVADALELAAAEIRRGESHERWLAVVPG